MVLPSPVGGLSGSIPGTALLANTGGSIDKGSNMTEIVKCDSCGVDTPATGFCRVEGFTDVDGYTYGGSYMIAVGICGRCDDAWSKAKQVDRVDADKVLDQVSNLLAQHQEDGELDDGELLDMVYELIEDSGRVPYKGDHLKTEADRLAWIDLRVSVARRLVRDQGWQASAEIQWLLGEIEIFADLLRVHFAGVEE